MLFGKPHSILGVDLGAGGVKVVELKQEKKRPVLFTYALTLQSALPAAFPVRQGGRGIKGESASTPPSQEIVAAYAEAIREVCAAGRVVSKNAIVSLPVASVFHAIVTVPSVDAKNFEMVLKAEVSKLLPYALSETVLDYQRLPANETAGSIGAPTRVLVNAVPRGLVSFYTEVFRAAGLTVEALETEATALSRSLVGRDPALTMVVDLGAERTNFFIVDKAVPVTYHSIELGGRKISELLRVVLGVSATEVEQLKRDLFTALSSGVELGVTRESYFKLFRTVIEPIVKEIADSFELYLRQLGNETRRPEKIILTGGASVFPYLMEHLSDKFKIKCYRGDPWGRVIYQDGLKPALSEIAPRMGVAIGLALRHMV